MTAKQMIKISIGMTALIVACAYVPAVAIVIFLGSAAIAGTTLVINTFT